MKAVEDTIRQRTTRDPNDYGVALVGKVMGKEPYLIEFSNVKSEQESAQALFRGAIGYLKNPRSHRFLDTKDPIMTFEALAFASLLMRMLDEVKQDGE